LGFEESWLRDLCWCFAVNHFRIGSSISEESYCHMNIFQARILSDGDIINKSNSRQAQTMICQRIVESTRPIFTCVHKSLFVLLPFILKSSANPALREQRKVTLPLFIKSSHFSDLSERTILTTSFVLLHHEIQEQKPLNHLLKHTISFSFSLKYGHSHIHQASNHQNLQPPDIHHLHTQQSKQPHLPTYPKTTILHPHHHNHRHPPHNVPHHHPLTLHPPPHPRPNLPHLHLRLQHRPRAPHPRLLRPHNRGPGVAHRDRGGEALERGE